MLVPNKMQHVICTGNLGSKQQYEELRQLARELKTDRIINQ
jgi:vacuolar protein sorting-associated protein 29